MIYWKEEQEKVTELRAKMFDARSRICALETHNEFLNKCVDRLTAQLRGLEAKLGLKWNEGFSLGKYTDVNNTTITKITKK